MQHAVHSGGFDPRLRHLLSSIIKVLQTNHVVVFSAHVVEDFCKYDANGEAGSVTRRDFDWMRECDIYVAVLPAGPDDLSYRSDGTHVELGWASALGKPILLLSSSGIDHSLVVQGLWELCAFHFARLEDVEISPERIMEFISPLASSW
jgi:nucleoside 2-deoxyribosyltransferase